MLEIIFKGKRKDNGEWVEGSAINTQYDVRGEKHIYIGVLMKSEMFSLMQTITWYEVIPETVGRYTGLTDKNGKKIFEGDIIEYEHELSGYLRFELGEDYKPRRSHSCHWDDKHYLHYKRNYAVEWKEKDARWILRNGSDQHDLRRISLSMHNGVVIGNIHDNPELLKGGNNGE